MGFAFGFSRSLGSPWVLQTVLYSHVQTSVLSQVEPGHIPVTCQGVEPGSSLTLVKEPASSKAGGT